MAAILSGSRQWATDSPRKPYAEEKNQQKDALVLGLELP